MYNLIISKNLEEYNWNDELKKNQCSNFFQTKEYLESQSNSNEKFPIFIMVKNETGKILGQLGVIVKKSPTVYSSKILKNISKIFSVLGNRISWVGGPIIHSEQKSEREEILEIIIQGLEQVSRTNDVFMIDGYTNPLDKTIDNNYKNKFLENGFSKINFLTYVLDLTKTDEVIWNGLNKSARRDVQKAEKKEIIVKEFEENDLEEFFKLSKIWGKTKGIEKSENSLNMKMYWEYYKKGTEKIFLAYENNELISSHRIGIFNKIAYSHSLISSYKKSGSIGGPYLTWYAMRWAKENGMKVYDFSGGEAPQKEEFDLKYEKQWGSLLAYKKKWGGEEIPYYHFVKIQKKNAQKIMRILLKFDLLIKNYNRKQFQG